MKGWILIFIIFIIVLILLRIRKVISEKIDNTKSSIVRRFRNACKKIITGC